MIISYLVTGICILLWIISIVLLGKRMNKLREAGLY